ncbi:uncharacterized protein LOC111022296 [Momordica charantia]|uniref:Uncharacterized protein LOC111022296 n=1 Tax=Momordica charantia TaxID=3673 RepID=A0A6J1DPE8_MOMCH|nr:uncharacterized protein LOC111022296 [Momordica charantia]
MTGMRGRVPSWYISTEVIRKNPLKWREVEAVYLPFNVNDNHWVMICIDFVEGEIVVWDSLMAITPDASLEEQLNVMRAVIPPLLHKSQAITVRPNLPMTPWRISRVTSTPQQFGSGDCGIFCVKYFEYDVTGTSLETLRQNNMSYFRRQFAFRL